MIDELLWQLKDTSPFVGGWVKEHADEPVGVTRREYLEIWVSGVDFLRGRSAVLIGW